MGKSTKNYDKSNHGNSDGNTSIRNNRNTGNSDREPTKQKEVIMGTWLEQLGQQVGGQVANSGIGAIFGSLLQKNADERQLRQQAKLQNLQVQGNKEMLDYTMSKQLQMWKDTNYSAQMAEIEKAGLNPALLYGMKGGGGTTTGSPGGGVSGGNAPSGGREIQDMMTYGVQSAQALANIELMKSQAAKNKAEAEKISGVDTEVGNMTIMNLAQDLNNKKASEELMRVDTKLKRLEAEFKGKTLEQNIERVGWELNRIQEDVDWWARQNRIAKSTENDVIATVHAEMLGAFIRNGLMKAQTEQSTTGAMKNVAEMQQIAHSIQQKWLELEYYGRSVTTGERQQRHQEFIDDVAKSTGIATEMVEKIIQAFALKGLLSPAGTNPVRGFHNR